MSDDQQYVSIHARIRHEMQKISSREFGTKIDDIKEYKGADLNDIQEIKQALTYILEKLTQLDSYVRGRRLGKGAYEQMPEFVSPDNRKLTNKGE